jgi:hypothetical protein
MMDTEKLNSAFSELDGFTASRVQDYDIATDAGHDVNF